MRKSLYPNGRLAPGDESPALETFGATELADDEGGVLVLGIYGIVEVPDKGENQNPYLLAAVTTGFLTRTAGREAPGCLTVIASAVTRVPARAPKA